MSVLDTALSYTAAGVAVFPVRLRLAPDGRKSVYPIKAWRDASSTDPAQVRRWFAPGADWADAGLAIDTGKSGLVVVDLDVGPGKDGPAAWAQLGVPATYEARTPSGGRHLFYRADQEHRVTIDSSGKVAPAVDVRGDGGFVIAPPSTDHRGAYHWCEGVPEWSSLPPVPGVVIERLAAAKRPLQKLGRVGPL